MNAHSKEPKDKSELHERIVTIAIEKFTQEGIKPVRMDDIANHLSISKRTLYEIFTDKEELLFECIKRRHEETRRYMARVYEASDNIMEVILHFYFRNLEELQTTNPRFFEDIKKYPDITAHMKKERESNRDTTIQFLQKGIEQGLFREDINLEIALMMMNSSGDFIAKEGLAQLYPLDVIFRNMVFIFIRGISTAKGQEIFDRTIAEYENRLPQTTHS